MKKLTSIILSLSLFLAVLSPSWSARADSQSERRAKTGVKVFRAMLAADLDIAEKKGKDGTLPLLIVFNSNVNSAEELGKALKEGGKDGKPALIRDIPAKAFLTGGDGLDEQLKNSYAGIFLAEPQKEETLRQLVDYSIKNKIILYSPFEGDVEKGALGGLSVEAKVQPYVNMKSLEMSGVRIKPFFIKVSKRYE